MLDKLTIVYKQDQLLKLGLPVMVWLNCENKYQWECKSIGDNLKGTYVCSGFQFDDYWEALQDGIEVIENNLR